MKKNCSLRSSCSKINFCGVHLEGPRGVAPSNYVKVFVSLLFYDIKKNKNSSLSRCKKWFVGVYLEDSRGRWYPQTTSKYLSLKYLLISKKLVPEIKPFKNWYLGSIWGPERVIPQNYVKVFVSLLSVDIRKSSILVQAVKKLIFGVHSEVLGVGTPK